MVTAVDSPWWFIRIWCREGFGQRAQGRRRENGLHVALVPLGQRGRLGAAGIRGSWQFMSDGDGDGDDRWMLMVKWRAWINWCIMVNHQCLMAIGGQWCGLRYEWTNDWPNINHAYQSLSSQSIMNYVSLTHHSSISIFYQSSTNHSPIVTQQSTID